MSASLKCLYVLEWSTTRLKIKESVCVIVVLWFSKVYGYCTLSMV